MSDPPDHPPNLGGLRGALEAALIRDPTEPSPPELAPILRVPLPPPQKCRVLDGAKLLRDNLELDFGGPPRGLGGLRTALSILEKYGRNLLHPRPPRHWRGVRFGNPVFKSTVGAIQGGRGVLRLLGYTEESGEGLSFPPHLEGPEPPRVASVTADVLVLRAELDLLLANQHPNPQFFTEILLGGVEQLLVSDAMPTADGVLPAGEVPQGPPQDPPNLGDGGGWACASCTFLNPPQSVLCGVCERPRLARRPSHTQQPPPEPAQVWPCPHCTYLNEGPAPTCAVCQRPLLATPPPAPGHAPSRDALRQQRLLNDGRRLVALVRAAESQGLPPESLSPSLFSSPPPPCSGISGGPHSPPSPQEVVSGFRARLGGLLQALVEEGERRGALEKGGPLGTPSLREAAWAWLKGAGQPDHALLALIGQRRCQLRALSVLGFRDRREAALALQRHGGDQWGALRELQRPRLRPFLQRLWRPPGALDFECPDQQALVRRILATLDVASWGRALLVASLGRELGLGKVEPGSESLLGELVEAVRDCPDRAALRRRLRCECAVCGWGLPRALMQRLPGCSCPLCPECFQLLCSMQWLPGCSCPLCPECFRLHFTVGVRERGVGALGCPSCSRPDLRDEAQRLWYWSTLEPQLRSCLDPDTFGLVTQKLTELELLRDPQFLWCPHCSFGFIFEAERGPAQCPQCHQCCCPRCQRPWDPQHSTLSCAEFGAWLSSRDPQGASGGLGAFLGEHGIVCPQCGLWFALARGGCLHFQCSQCRHQFCAGCGATFHGPGTCPSPECPLRGSLHGHHPRNCLFYLRDWDPPRLQSLLQMGNVPFETEPPPDAPPNPTGRCPVLEQKEFGAALRDEPCGEETAPGQAGLCRGHYSEYLVGLVNRHGLDPAPLYDRAELRAAAERHLPAGRTRRGPAESDGAFEQRLRHLLEREAPLRPRPHGQGHAPLCK